MSMLKPCSFCDNPVVKGSGTMLAKNDGTVLWFCSSKCKKNALVLKRDPRKIKWNFTKFLIDQNGQTVKRYAPKTTPEQISSDVKDLLEGTN